MLASTAFSMDYWDCTEFDRDGKFQQEGKNRRQQGKVIQLGVSYGMGAKKLADEVNKKKKPGEEKMTLEEAETMMTTFFGKFTSLKTWKDYNAQRLEQFGYMETAMGRRRRLFDTWLPDYDVKAYKIEPIEDVLFGMEIGIEEHGHVHHYPHSIKIVDKDRTQEIIKKLDSCPNRFKKKDLVEDLEEDPLNHIKSNGGFKSRPKTQSTNFVIQGGSAELTKKAMVALYNHPDKERLGLGILAPVHDEILVEGYMEYRDEVLKVLSTCMSNSAKGVYEVNMICDGVKETQWNLGHYTDKIQKEYKKNGGDIQAIYKAHPEVEHSTLDRIVSGEFDVETERLIPTKNLCI